MSAADKKAVKAAVANYLDNFARQEVSPREVANFAADATGLHFAPTTIARFIGGHGWTRYEVAGGRVFYCRPKP